MRPTSALALVLLATSPVTAAPSGGATFRAGDLYLQSDSSDDLRRVAPCSGSLEVLVPPSALQIASGLAQKTAYDPWRDRILVAGRPAGFTGNGLWAVDAAGGLEELLPPGINPVAPAPTGDGRVYLHRGGEPHSALRYLDAGGTLQVLFDATGTVQAQFAPGIGGSIRRMVYHPGENALFAVASSNNMVCSGGISGAVNLYKVPLSEDGSRVGGEVLCTQFDVVVGQANEIPMGLSLGAADSLLLVVDNNSSGAAPRILSVDPTTAALSAYATVGPFSGDNSLGGGTYSQVLGRAVVLDAFNDVLRAFGAGSSGEGFAFAPGVSNPNSNSDWVDMVEIRPLTENDGLSTATDSISLSSGGEQVLTHAHGAAQAGRLYWLLGSLSGWCPGIDALGVHLPLNVDAWLLLTLSQVNLPPYVDSFGLLDAAGQAESRLVLPPGLDPSLAGVLLYHAAVVFELGGGADVTRVSNAVPIELVP